MEPKILTEEYMDENIKHFFNLEKEWEGIGEEPWNEEKFFLPKPKKWYFSSYVDVDGSLVGYTIVAEVEKPNVDERQAYLHKIVVDRDFERLGIGSILFEDMVRKCRDDGISSIIFKCRIENEKANNFYLKHGCIIKGTEPRKPGVDMYLLEKKL